MGHERPWYLETILSLKLAGNLLAISFKLYLLVGEDNKDCEKSRTSSLPHNKTQEATLVTTIGSPPCMESGIAIEQQQLITPPSQKPLLLRMIEKVPNIAHPGQIGGAREQKEEKVQELALSLKGRNITVMASTREAPVFLDKVEGGVPEGTHGKWVSVKAFFGLPWLVKRVFERPLGAMLSQNQDRVWDEPEAAADDDVWSEDLDKLEAAAAVWAADIVLTESERPSRESQSQLIRMLQQLPEKRPLQEPQGTVKKHLQILQLFQTPSKRKALLLVAYCC